MSTPCPFCTLANERIVATNELAVVIRDGFPVSPGHTLVIPKRHVASWFDATPEEQLAVMSLLAQAKQQLDAEHAPAGYNIGINDGPAAGQTVRHLHLHLIPLRRRHRGPARRRPLGVPAPGRLLERVTPGPAKPASGSAAAACGT